MLVTIAVGLLVLWLVLKVVTGLVKDTTKGVRAVGDVMNRAVDKLPRPPKS